MKQNPPTFLKTAATHIVHDKKRVHLKGVNLGGWLMMEGYILYSLNHAEQAFKKNFKKDLGERALRDFEASFRQNFIREADFKTIARMGLNCVRVPFNYRLIESSPYRYDRQGVRYLDNVIRWAEKYRLWVILDLHAACGAQNHDWHSDSLGPADLWKKKSCQQRTFALWEFLADRYQDKEAVAGYDLLNEAVLANTKVLNAFYKQLIKTIRGVDRHHILFVEGNTWATDLACLDRFNDDNLCLSVHFYDPFDYVCNMVSHLTYPLKSKQGTFGRAAIDTMMRRHEREAKRRSRPVLVGEFGINGRQGLYHEDRWLKDVLASFKKMGFHWTYWTYKAVKNGIFPDGLFSYMPNSPWVNRLGPRLGWDNYSTCWRKHRGEMIRSWRTDRFQENKVLTQVLKQAAKRKL